MPVTYPARVGQAIDGRIGELAREALDLQQDAANLLFNGPTPGNVAARCRCGAPSAELLPHRFERAAERLQFSEDRAF